MSQRPFLFPNNGQHPILIREKSVQWMKIFGYATGIEVDQLTQVA